MTKTRPATLAKPLPQLWTIQPHGCLVVFACDERHTIMQASANLGDFLAHSAESALGLALAELIGTKAVALLEQDMQQQIPSSTLLLTVNGQQQSLELEAYLYNTQDCWVLEFMLSDDLVTQAQLGKILLSLQQSLQNPHPSLAINSYFEHITPLIRELTGYDSVMTYRFTGADTGLVIAQSRIEQAPDYLGFHFPASDIPPHTRALYTKNCVRQVCNVTDTPIALVPSLHPHTKLPLDLSYSTLGNFSTKHSDYLTSMGLAASLSIALIQNGQLWGLIICHHLSPKCSSLTLRLALEFVSRTLSTELTAQLLLEQQDLHNKAAEIKRTLLNAIPQNSERDILTQLSFELLALANATGLLVISAGTRHSLGKTPDPEQVDELLNCLSLQSFTDCYSCTHLATLYPAASIYADLTTGLLVIAPNHDLSHSLIWFRTEAYPTLHNTDAKLGSCEPWSTLQTTCLHKVSLTLLLTLTHKQDSEKRAAEKLRLHELTLSLEREHLRTLDNLQKITNRIPGAVFQLKHHADNHVSFPYVSTHIKELFKLHPDDIKDDAVALFDRVHPDDLAGAWQALTDSAANRSLCSHELRVCLSDDSFRWLQCNALPEAYNEADGSILWHGYISDISEQKQIELDLLEAQNIVERSQSIANLGSWSYTLETDTLLCSPQMYVIYGLNKADFAHNLSALMACIVPEDRLLLNTWLRQLSSHLAKPELLFRILHTDGQQRFLKAYATIEYTVDQQISRYVGCTQDVTERIHQEQQDLMHLDQLAHITRLGLMGEMATGIAHELNQPLTAVTNYASALKLLANKAEPDLEKIAKVAGQVTEQALRAGKIIHRMKDFCKAQKILAAKVDLNTLINDCIVLCNNDLNKHNITLQLELADTLPMLLLDSIKIEQVLINLIRNGTEALAAHDNSLAKTMTLSSLRLDEHSLQIQVKDNGPGIATELQNQLFTPFFTTKTEGMGMGLSICRSLIVAHQGTLTFDSQLGLGTCFYITLPVQ